MGHFNHRLSRKRGCKRLERKDAGQDQAEAALNCAQRLPSGRTSAQCDTATDAINLELRGFLQLNNRQMPAARQMLHGQSGQGYGVDSR
jgi:hypothetical protein